MKANIVDYLHGVFVKDKKRWVSPKVIEKLVRFSINRPSTVGRRCRELAEDGIIERYEVTKTGKRAGFVLYRWKPLRKSLVFKKKEK